MSARTPNSYFYFASKVTLSLRRMVAGTSGSPSLPQGESLPEGEYTKVRNVIRRKGKRSGYASANFSGEENGDGSDGGVGGDGAPCRRSAEKGEEKEEVVNVEKPRRNPKRRCIDSNRWLSYPAAADLPGTSRLTDIRRYCPAIPPPPFLTSLRTRTKALLSAREKCPLSPPPTSSLPRMRTHYLA